MHREGQLKHAHTAPLDNLFSAPLPPPPPSRAAGAPTARATALGLGAGFGLGSSYQQNQELFHELFGVPSSSGSGKSA